MVIWVIGRNYPTSENGMQGTFELEQAKILSRKGNDVCYLSCSLHPKKRIRKRGFQSWTEDGVKVFVLSAFFFPRVYPLYFVKLRNWYWRKLLKKVETEIGTPDVIHIHYPAMLMIAEALREYREKGVVIAATEHWSKVQNKELDSIEKREFIKTSEVVDSVICVGTPLGQAVREITGKQAVLVPNIVSGLFKPASQKHEGFRFVAVGRLVKLKQFDKMIEAFTECFAGRMDVTLTIIGNGEEKDNLQKLIKEKSITDQVKLSGGLTREKTAEAVSNCDVLLCYSIYETFGVPIIEAWACGLTTIVTNTAAVVQDYFDQGLGIRVSPNNIDELKKAMREIHSDSGRFDKKYIAQFAQANFSENTVFDRLMTIYSDKN